MSPNKTKIAKRFAKIRGTRSYRAFSDDTGISVSLLQRYETEGGLPSAENIIALAETQSVSPTWLLLGVGPLFLR